MHISLTHTYTHTIWDDGSFNVSRVLQWEKCVLQVGIDMTINHCQKKIKWQVSGFTLAELKGKRTHAFHWNISYSQGKKTQGYTVVTRETTLPWQIRLERSSVGCEECLKKSVLLKIIINKL